MPEATYVILYRPLLSALGGNKTTFPLSKAKSPRFGNDELGVLLKKQNTPIY